MLQWHVLNVGDSFLFKHDYYLREEMVASVLKARERDQETGGKHKNTF